MINLNRIEKNILVVDDVMLDTYYNGEVKRISPEAPVPVFRKTSERRTLGGVANVAANLVASGQNVSIMATIGNDDVGNVLKCSFESSGIGTKFLVALDKETTTKIRFLANNDRQVIRLDIENTELLNHNGSVLLLEQLEKEIATYSMRYDAPEVAVSWGELLNGIAPILSEKDTIGSTLSESNNRFICGKNC